MFEGCFEAEIESPEDPEDDLVEQALADPLSWRLDDIDNEVGGKGWKDKFNIGMAIQLGLMIFYAVIYSVTFAGINAYYEWPLPNIDDIVEMQWRKPSYELILDAILTDEEYFECEDRSFYLNETGPILDVSNVKIVYDNGANDIVQGLGFFWGLLIVFFASFIVIKLRSGQFNQLLLVVKFKKEKTNGKIKPQKMSFAWSIMCNAKTFSSLVFTSLCDKMSFAVTLNNFEDPEARTVSSASSEGIGPNEILAVIFFIFWFILVLWIILYVITCGCRRRVDCITTPKCQKTAYFVVFRIVVILNVIVMFTAWLVNFDPSLEFNFERPVLAFTNIVSWCDLAINIAYDIYDATRRVRSCGAPVPDELEDKEQESTRPDKEEQEDGGDEEDPQGEPEDEPPPEMAPQQQSFHAPQPYGHYGGQVHAMENKGPRKSVTHVCYPDGTKEITETILNQDGSKTVTITTERPRRLVTAYQPAVFAVRSSSSLST